jgi:hypothetical protein
MTHFQQYIEQCRGSQQLSTEVGEAPHRNKIKNGYRASNQSGDIHQQIIKYYPCTQVFAVWRMNLNTNCFNNMTSTPPELDVNYLTAATG